MGKGELSNRKAGDLMKCPNCEHDMRAGVIEAGDTSIKWYRKEIASHKSFDYTKLLEPADVSFGAPTSISTRTRVPDAYFCDNCGTMVLNSLNAVMQHKNDFKNL